MKRHADWLPFLLAWAAFLGILAPFACHKPDAEERLQGEMPSHYSYALIHKMALVDTYPKFADALRAWRDANDPETWILLIHPDGHTSGIVDPETWHGPLQ